MSLSAGFGAFLGRLDGRASADSLLAQFQQAGAPGQVVDSVRGGLLRLVRERALLEGDIPSAMNPPPGCRFHTRCPRAMDACRSVEPPMIQRGDRAVACHLYGEG